MGARKRTFDLMNRQVVQTSWIGTEAKELRLRLPQPHLSLVDRETRKHLGGCSHG
ncbi:hypothetical protein ABTJ92_21140 [Acinetobacter baumannii]